MNKLLAAAAGLVLLSACGDPTKKHDYGCTRTFGEGTAAMAACTEFHITEPEGNAAEVACKNKAGGAWAYHACDTAQRVPGYCLVPDAADYSLSGTPARVYFYSAQWDQPAAAEAARAACTSVSGTTWNP